MNWKNLLLVIILEAMVFMGFIIYNHSKYNYKIDKLEQNLMAQKDEMDAVTLENGSLLEDKYSSIIREKELCDELNMTKDQKKELERKLDDKIAHIAKLEASVEYDTIATVKDSIVYRQDSSIVVKFKYDDKWLKFNGVSDIQKRQTTLSNITIPTPLTIGLTDDYKFFVVSDNPYLNITHINSNVIDGTNIYKKPKKWSISIQGGFGAQYDIISHNFGVGPYGGFGISYAF